MLFAASVVLGAEPSSTEKLCSTAAYYLAIGDYSRALKALPAVPSQGGSDAAQANLRGVAEMMNGRTERAMELFDAALAADANFSQARFNRGIAQLKLKRFSEAMQTLRPIAEDDENYLRAAAAYHLALALDQNGQPEVAEKWLEVALAADPGLDSALLFLGTVREKQKKFAAAGEAYREYMRRHPDSVVAILRFGVSAHRAGYHPTAKKYLRQVVELSPSSLEAAEARKFLVMWD